MPLYEQEYVDDPTYDGDIEMDDELDMDDSLDFDEIDATIDREARAAQLETPGASDEVEMGTSGESRTPPNPTPPIPTPPMVPK